VTYADHVQAASRYAAALLTMPTPTGEQAGPVRVLQDDLAALLAEMTREITGLAPVEPLAVEVSDLARHPVRMMLNRLHALPARAGYDEPAAAPSDRLTGRPAAPERARSPVQAWQGLVAETAQARHLLTAHAPLLADPQRWDALADVAALAETLATTRIDILAAVDADTPAVRRERSHTAALAVEAREVARQAGAPTTPTGAAWGAPRHGSAVVFVARVGDLPAAAGNLGSLLQGGHGSITDLLTVTGLLAQTSRAAAAGLHAAVRHDPTQARTLLPAALVLEGHADALARALSAERAGLAALAGSSRVLLAQAREIGACALPRLADLATHPARVAAAVPDLLAYAALTPALTAAVRVGVARTTRQHTVAIRDRLDRAPYRWRPASTVDLARFTANLSHAAAIAEPPTAPAPAGTPAGRPPVAVGLATALERRRDELRPAKPSTATLNGRFATVRRNDHPRPPTWM